MSIPDISIVIVNYNVKDFLYQCLLSIRGASTGLTVETIVVDNNSQDDSMATLPALFPEVVFKKLDVNLGFGRANNIGFELSCGKYILILNPDTILQEDTLSIMYDYMEAHSEVGLAGCKVLNADGTFQLPCRRGFPTPWVAFCKLFGLQKIFPKSPVFARYNQTFRNENETYYIDAVIGAFMFARKEVIEKLQGFDPDFFMYGEDLDLCYRTNQLGYKVAYVHTTSIIHYKGESTKRSSINDMKHFYEAMEIFASKHFANSRAFLLFLKLGIKLRAAIAFVNRSREDVLFALTDLLMLNLFMLLSTNLRYGNFFNLPQHAYPTVFIVMTITLFIAMISVGEYFESGKSVKRSFQSLLITFFILSSLTYYFKDYAFSRGVLLMTVGFTMLGTSFTRLCLILFNRMRGKQADKNIAVAGYSDEMQKIIDSLLNSDARNANFVGIINIGAAQANNISGLPVIGNFEYIDKIVSRCNLNEVIVNSNLISNNELLNLIAKNDHKNVRFHLVKEYDDIVTARILDDITNSESTIPDYRTRKFRVRFYKRLTDLLFAIIMLTAFLPITLLIRFRRKNFIRSILNILSGRKTLVGLYPTDNTFYRTLCREGVISLARIGQPQLLTSPAIDKLNDYYIKNYSISLDLDILIKYLMRKK